ncbi:hypothetical protein ACLHDG_07635 [Sulfurovum sp. CS9]|uniref:hypothetical protein n=1 Tax=Sulfurovum sp. CS9 TaxID=3391146 RepID=UPI0039EB45B1
MVRHKTIITADLLNQVEELTSQGFNNVMISQSLNIGRQTLSTNKDLKDSIQRGRLTLSKQVTQTVLNTLETNPTNQQMLIKRLCLFNPLINIKKPTNANDALSNLATATKAYANGEINESQLRTIEAVSNSYVKGHEVTELEARIKALEDL